jgi:broad specificity phosphatase PhoE
MKLLLIRHAESLGNAEGRMQGQSEFPLTDRGRAQAQALGQRLQDEDWPLAAIYASDLSRAAETAQIVAGAVHLDVRLDERLREYDLGMLNGVIWQEVEFLHPQFWKGYHERDVWGPIPGEEGNRALYARLAAALADVQVHHPGDDAVAMVSHAGCLGAILSHLLGLEPRWPAPFHFGNASLTSVDLSRRAPALTLHNDQSHLHRDLR